jgi:hypothetical protein
MSPALVAAMARLGAVEVARISFDDAPPIHVGSDEVVEVRGRVDEQGIRRVLVVGEERVAAATAAALAAECFSIAEAAETDGPGRHDNEFPNRDRWGQQRAPRGRTKSKGKRR